MKLNILGANTAVLLPLFPVQREEVLDPWWQRKPWCKSPVVILHVC
uniref:Uncharacterized protein n=1 Tax=Arundo donax TaxID=35708 RepID=A0A0A9GG68_ARUDO